MLSSDIDLNNPNTVALLDELSLWSAPFGLRLLDTVHLKKGISVLDIGFGTGFPLIELAMRLGPESKVYGIDPWKEAINRTNIKIKHYGLSNVQLIEGCAEHISLPDGTIDLIVSNNGINNVQDLDKTISECNRVSRSGAQFVFTMNTNLSFNEFYDIYRQTLTKLGHVKYILALEAHIYDLRKPENVMVEALSKNGFRVNQRYHDGFYYRFATAKALFNHYFMRLAFIPSWEAVIPTEIRNDVFSEIERRIDEYISMFGEFKTQIPFITFDCSKV